MIYLNTNLKHLRKTVNDLSQRQLAQRIGVNRWVIGAYEENRCLPTIPVLIKTARYFKVSVDEILTTDVSQQPTDQLQIEIKKDDSIDHPMVNRIMEVK